MTMETTTAEPQSGNPIRLDVDYPESSSRLLNGLLFIKFILAIPHLLIIYALGILLNVIALIAIVAILFTKKYPRGLFDFAVNIVRWQTNVGSYILMLRDEYPPFSWDAGQYPVTFEVDYPENPARFAPLYKWILVIPNLIVWYIFALIAVVLWLVAWIAIIFSGKFPRGMFDFIVGVMRWQNRIYGYAVYQFTDVYPPFSQKP